jgi:hypothetical protein
LSQWAFDFLLMVGRPYINEHLICNQMLADSMVLGILFYSRLSAGLMPMEMPLAAETPADPVLMEI